MKLKVYPRLFLMSDHKEEQKSKVQDLKEALKSKG